MFTVGVVDFFVDSIFNVEIDDVAGKLIGLLRATWLQIVQKSFVIRLKLEGRKQGNENRILTCSQLSAAEFSLVQFSPRLVLLRIQFFSEVIERRPLMCLWQF